MTAEAPRSRKIAARAETHETLVDLLVAHVDRAYVTAGSARRPGGGARPVPAEWTRRRSPKLAYKLDLEAEPAKEEEPDSVRRERDSLTEASMTDTAPAFVVPLSSVTLADIDRVGGKNASLGRNAAQPGPTRVSGCRRDSF